MPTALRWVDRERLHVTVRFLGDQPDEALASIVDRLAAPPSARAAFDAAVDGVDWLPSRSRPRVMIGRFAAGCDGLRGVRRDVDQRLGGLVADHDEGRPFTPHVTLARMREGRGARAAGSALTRLSLRFAAVMHVDAVVLYASRLGRAGPSYEPLARMRLTRTPDE